MIISASMRTDIPAFFSDWFYNRVQEGYVYARNPYYPEQVTKYWLSPEVVDCISFCTKNPTPMLERLDELKAYRQFWSVIITPYGKDIVRQNMKLHNLNSPFLIGSAMEADIVKEAKQETYIDGQLSLFLDKEV